MRPDPARQPRFPRPNDASAPAASGRDKHDERADRMIERLRTTIRMEAPDPRTEVLEALRRVPRHRFVPEVHQEHAEEDTALPIGEGQTISAPHMVALMADLLHVRPGDRVLEIGTGSGYNAAVMATLAGPEGSVWSIEIVEPLAYEAMDRLHNEGYGSVRCFVGDGLAALPEDRRREAFDRIVVTAAAPLVPDAWVAALRPGGRIVTPVAGRTGGKDATTWLWVGDKSERGSMRWRRCGACRFVPLTGEHGHHLP